MTHVVFKWNRVTLIANLFDRGRALFNRKAENRVTSRKWKGFSIQRTELTLFLPLSLHGCKVQSRLDRQLRDV